MKGRVLDAGCAFGFLLKRLNPYFDELQGLDVSKYAIWEAQKEAPTAKLKVIDIDTDDLPYLDNYFDLITALDVLEHTKSVENNLNKLVKKLKKEGYLIMTLPLKETWAGKIFEYFDKDISHISIPSKKNVLKIVDLSGLKVVEKRFFFNLILFRIRYIPVSIELILQKN
jgi:predicted TPR repeat methyltransferase